jgi:hypothetical protein
VHPPPELLLAAPVHHYVSSARLRGGRSHRRSQPREIHNIAAGKLLEFRCHVDTQIVSNMTPIAGDGKANVWEPTVGVNAFFPDRIGDLQDEVVPFRGSFHLLGLGNCRSPSGTPISSWGTCRRVGK